MNDFIDVVDTAILPNKDLKYTRAEKIVSRTTPNTSKESSTVPIVISSKIHGVISIRTIPTDVQKTVSEKQTTLL
jgi:hypothetical protein